MDFRPKKRAKTFSSSSLLCGKVSANSQRHTFARDESKPQIEALPDEILVDIFLFLKQYAAIASMVCVRWCNILRDPKFKEILAIARRKKTFKKELLHSLTLTLTHSALAIERPEIARPIMNVAELALMDGHRTLLSNLSVPAEPWWIFPAAINGDIKLVSHVVVNHVYDTRMVVMLTACVYARMHGQESVCNYLFDLASYDTTSKLHNVRLLPKIKTTNPPVMLFTERLNYVFTDRLGKKSVRRFLCFNGHLGVIKWMINYTDLFKEPGNKHAGMMEEIFNAAVAGDHLNVVEFLTGFAPAAPIEINKGNINSVAMMEFLLQKKLVEIHREDEVSHVYAMTDNLEMIQYMHKTCGLSRFTAASAACQARSRVFMWIVENTQAPIDDHLYCIFAARATLSQVEWVRKRGYGATADRELSRRMEKKAAKVLLRRKKIKALCF